MNVEVCNNATSSLPFKNEIDFLNKLMYKGNGLFIFVNKLKQKPKQLWNACASFNGIKMQFNEIILPAIITYRPLHPTQPLNCF
jgi:hypothetical protein